MRVSSRSIETLIRPTVVVGSAAALCLAATLASAEPARNEEGKSDGIAPAEQLWQKKCASCHDNPTSRIPPRNALSYSPPHAIVRALTTGSMRPMAVGLEDAQIRSLAEFLTGRAPREAPVPEPPLCTGEAAARGANEVASSDWAQTGRSAANDRFQSAGGIGVDSVRRLELAWALAIPGGAPGPPVVVGDVVLQTTGLGSVLALDAATGCKRWSYANGPPVRSLSAASTPASGGELRVFFGDHHGFVSALDVRTGTLRWKTRIEDHVLAKVTAAPTIAGGRVFVGMSSIEDPLTHDPTHACCTFRGSVTALDAVTGDLVWKSHTIEAAPREVAPATDEVTARFAPAGGAVYTPVAVDLERGRVYVSTAEAYTSGDAAGAYSVIAFDFATGDRAWERQFLPEPSRRAAVCEEIGDTDCRNVFSMGTSVTIHTPESTAGGAPLLVVGQKWGFVYGLDPDAEGAVRWSRRVSGGSDMGGIMYGLADDGERIYAAISDLYDEPPEAPGGLVALHPATGEIAWRVGPIGPNCSWGEAGCTSAQSSAPTAIPGAVFAASWDGHVRAHASADGALIWDFDTGREFDAVNGVPAQGGQVAGWPVIVANGRVFVTSGASSMARPGNALLVFTPRAP